MNNQNELIDILEDLLLVLDERVRPFALPPLFRERIESHMRVARRVLS